MNLPYHGPYVSLTMEEILWAKKVIDVLGGFNASDDLSVDLRPPDTLASKVQAALDADPRFRTPAKDYKE